MPRAGVRAHEHCESFVDGSMRGDTDPTTDGARSQRGLAITAVVFGAIALYTLRGLLAPMIVGAWFAAIASPTIRRLAGRSHRKDFVAAVATFLLVVTILLPIALLALPVAQLVSDASQTLFRGSPRAALRDLAATVASAPHTHRGALEDVWAIGRTLGPGAARVASRAFATASAAFLQLVTLVASAYVFTANGREIVDVVRRGLPLEPSYFDRLVHESLSVARALFVGGLLTAIAQGVVAGIAYAIVRVEDAALLAVLTGIASFVPIIGTAIVWVPICALLAGSGRTRDAIVLAAFGLLVIGTVDNLVRPLVSRLGAREMHPLVLFLGVLGGLTTFGPWGLVTGPLVLALFLAAFRLRADARTPART